MARMRQGSSDGWCVQNQDQVANLTLPQALQGPYRQSVPLTSPCHQVLIARSLLLSAEPVASPTPVERGLARCSLVVASQGRRTVHQRTDA